MNNNKQEKITLPQEILDAIVLYLKDEIIAFYSSKEGQAYYEQYQKDQDHSSNNCQVCELHK